MEVLTKIINKVYYRIKNKHNFTNIKNIHGIRKINVGKGTYGTIDVKTYRGENCNLIIGNYCSISNGCVFLMGGEHGYDTLSTYPFKAKIFNQAESMSKGDIIIKDDVWIGYGCTILSGVTIGQGAIIGTGSVVAKDIPPYAIYAGGSIIKYRFSDNIIKKLIKLDYSKIDENFIKNNIEMLYEKITENNIDEIINAINKYKN